MLKRIIFHCPNKDKLCELVNKVEVIIDDINKLADEPPNESQQRNKTTDNSTEPKFLNEFLMYILH